MVLLVSTQLSHALDANDFAEKFVAAYATGGMTLEYTGVSEDGNNVTLQGVTVGADGEPETLGLGDMSFNGVTEDGSGGYLVNQVVEDSIAYSTPEFSFSLSDLVINNLKVPAEANLDSIDDVLYYDSASTGPMVVTIQSVEVFKIANSMIDLSKASDNSRMDFQMRMDGMGIDLSMVQDTRTKQAIDGMGYGYVNGGLVINGLWAPPTGELTLNEYALTLDDVGRLDLQLSISGYTLEFVQGIQKLQEQMSGADEKAQQAMGLAMLGMMQQLTFNSLSLRFDDASVTNKVLDLVASQQGMSREQMVQGLQGMLPFVLAQLQNPEFQQQISEAVGAYLADPKNIEISAQPSGPLPFASLVGAAMTAWQSLPEMLNVQVTANQ
ncbi:MAG: hypothetical protein AAGC96_04805 [Pseudomonadota bacterium]